MRIERYQQQTHSRLWDNFIGERAKNAHFMHTRRYLEYHGDRFDDHSLLFLDKKNNLCAVLPAHASGGTLSTHSGVSFAGLLVDRNFRLGQWRAAIKALGNYGREAGFFVLDYRATPHWYHSSPSEEDAFLFESAGAKPYLLVSSICRINGSFPGNATRRNEAGAGGVRIRRGSDDLEPVMKLVETTLHERHQARPVHSLEEIRHLATQFPENILVYSATDDSGNLKAGMVLYVSAEVVKLQYVGYSCSRAMTALYAAVFTETEFAGRWFDFGTSMSENAVNEGLFSYKESMGGRLALVRRYQLDFSKSPFM